MIDPEELYSSLEGDTDAAEKPEILEAFSNEAITVWALTDLEETEDHMPFRSHAFENLDKSASCSTWDVMNAAMEHISGRRIEKGGSFFEMLRQMEISCTVLSRPIEPGRAAGCIANGGCAVLLGDQAVLEQFTGEGDIPVAVGGIKVIPIYAADERTVWLQWTGPDAVDAWTLKKAGCRLVEVYK